MFGLIVTDKVRSSDILCVERNQLWFRHLIRKLSEHDHLRRGGHTVDPEHAGHPKWPGNRKSWKMWEGRRLGYLV